MDFCRNRSASTFLKYLVSYILIFTIMLFCFFLIFRSQLAESYSARQKERVFSQMEASVSHLSSEIRFLVNTELLITENSDLKLALYKADPKYWRIAYKELIQYADSSSLIDSIVLYSRYSDYVFATKEYVTQADEKFTITNGAMKKVFFDPTPYIDSANGQLIWLEGSDSGYLLYFPVNQSRSMYLYFFILDNQLIQSQLNPLLSDEVLAVALLDKDGRCVTGSDFLKYESSLDGNLPAQGIYPMENGLSTYISSPIQDGFALAAIVSEGILKTQLSKAFLHSYISLLGLSLLGVVLVYIAMRFTYRPLLQLMKNLGYETGRHQNFLEMISRSHSELIDQKEKLEKALAEYRESFAKNSRREAVVLDYPHEELGNLAALLRMKDFSGARELVAFLMSRTDGSPGFFQGCIALDCLFVITNSMSHRHIEFETYAEIYTHAVQQCRKIPHVQSFENTTKLIQELLLLYEQEIAEKDTHAAPLKEFVERRFSDPDFSISEMAEAYHISTSQMSSLFKREMSMGFMEYVWQMRLKKAQELLRTTQLSVDEISVQVGYLAATSFSRKFKAETGMTPSQYRSKYT